MILKIQLERMAHGWTQAYVAKRVGISLGSIKRIENGKINPRYDNLVKLEDLFGMSHRELFSVIAK